MPTIVSPARAVFANKATGGGPTGPFSTRDVRAVKFGVWLGGITNLTAQPGYEFSDDGVDWSGTVHKKNMTTGSATTSTPEWTWGDQTTYFDIPGAGETPGSFVRFGVVTSTTSTKDAEYANARILVRVKPVVSSTRAAPPTRVWTSNPNVFIPLTGPIPASEVVQARAELELSDIGAGGGITVQAGFQQANDPGVDTDWATVTTFGSS